MKKLIPFIATVVIVGVFAYVSTRPTPIESLSAKIDLTLLQKKRTRGQMDYLYEKDGVLIVSLGYGGYFEDYRAVAEQAIENNMPIHVIEDCMSACPHMLHVAASAGVPVCLDEDARLGFHRGRSGTKPIDISHYYSEDVVRMVNTKGGFSNGLEWGDGADLTYLYADDLANIYPICGAG